MIDPFVLLTPVLLLGVFALLRFVGCFIKPEPPAAVANFNAVGTPNSITGTTNPFSAHAGELLLAFVAAGQDVVTGVSTPGLIFTLVLKETGGGGTAEIWQAVPSNDLSNVVVTASTSAASSVFVYVVSFSSNAGTTPVVGNTAHMSGSDGHPLATLAASSVNSLVFGVGNDYDNATTPQEGANQVIVQPLITDPPNKNTFWVQRRTDTPLGNTQTQIEDTLLAGDHWNLCICEIHA